MRKSIRIVFPNLLWILLPVVRVVGAPELLSSRSLPPIGASFSTFTLSPLPVCGMVTTSSEAFGCTEGQGGSDSCVVIDSASLAERVSLVCFFLGALDLTCSLAGLTTNVLWWKRCQTCLECTGWVTIHPLYTCSSSVPLSLFSHLVVLCGLW